MSHRDIFSQLLRASLLILGAIAAKPALAVVGPAQVATGSAQVVMVLNSETGAAGFCTGVVLAQDVVMTAAHCVPKGASLRIHYPAEGATPVMLPIIGIARHPDYHADAIKTRERSIDLALIRLQKPLPDRFSPATLARAAGAKPGARFVISGYGVGQEGSGASSGVLRRATLVTRAPLSNVLLWAEDATKAGLGACTGDSGGPVTAEGSTDVSALILWSAGPNGKQCGDLTQSLWLAPHRAWIDRVLQAWGIAPSL